MRWYRVWVRPVPWVLTLKKVMSISGFNLSHEYAFGLGTATVARDKLNSMKKSKHAVELSTSLMAAFASSSSSNEVALAVMSMFVPMQQVLSTNFAAAFGPLLVWWSRSGWQSSTWRTFLYRSRVLSRVVWWTSDVVLNQTHSRTLHVQQRSVEGLLVTAIDGFQQL